MKSSSPYTPEQILAAIPDPVLMVDREMRITGFNQAAERLTGLKADDVMGKPCHDVMKPSKDAGAWDLGGCFESEQGQVELRTTITSAAGAVRHVVVRGSRMEGDNGHAGAIATFRDMTEYLDLEERAEEYHEATMELAMGISDCFQVLAEVENGNLEARVGEDTLNSSDELIASLGRALNETIEGVHDNMETIHRMQQMVIQELSTPLLQVWDGVLALPVIGVVDTKRSAQIMEKMLQEIVDRQSRFVILDITGVEVVDTKTADHFIKVVKASSLLGATCIITGIRPAVAQTLVDIGVDLSGIMTLGNLREGLAWCLRELRTEKAGRKAPKNGIEPT